MKKYNKQQDLTELTDKQIQPAKRKRKQKEPFAADSLCKCLFQYKVVLAMILRGLIKEFHNATLEQIIQCINAVNNVSDNSLFGKIIGDATEVTALGEKKSLYDFTFHVCLPNRIEQLSIDVHVDLEAQKELKLLPYPIEKRADYYVAKLLTRQIKPGDNYNKLKKCYSIWFCENVDEAERDTVTYITMQADTIGSGTVVPKAENYDLMNVIIVRLRKFDKNTKATSDLEKIMKLFDTAMDLNKVDTLNDLINDMPEFEKDKSTLNQEVNEFMNFKEELEKLGEIRGEVKGAIKTYKKLNIPEDIIKTNIMEEYHLNEEEYLEFIHNYT